MIVTSWDGFKWNTDIARGDEVLSRGECTVLRAMYEIAKKYNNTFVDCGTFIGYYSVRMSKVFKKVISFEPNPATLPLLYENLSLNNVTNVKVHEVAVGDVKSKAVLKLRRGMSTLLDVDCCSKTEVAVDTLDNLLAGEDKIDLIKLDVEGYEEKVLLGAKNIISKHKPLFIIEHHDLRGYNIKGTKERIQKMLKDYTYFNLDGIHYLYVPAHVKVSDVQHIVADYWISKTYRNVEKGKPWYYGLPYQWWYGFQPVDFAREIDEHINENEPLWFVGGD
jgi:FkbM family methyltransferase